MFIFILVGFIVFVILRILSYPRNELFPFLISYSFFSSLLIILSLSKSISLIICVCIFLYFILPPISNYRGKTWESIINFYGFYREANFRGKILTVSVGFLFLLLLLFSIQISHISPPALSPSTQSKISKIFETIPKGLFVYSCSKEMTVGIPETCTARIANDKYLSNFRKAINKGLNPQYIEEIKLQYVNSIMSVKLTGKNFDIELKGNAEDQVIEDRSFSSWQWDVTPREAGMQKLDFIVSVILRIPGYEELPPKCFEANTIEVSVKVNPSFSLKFFMRQNWKYLTATIFVLLYFTVSWFTETKKREAIMVNEGDTYNIGQAGAAGKFASSHNNTFVQSEQKVTLAEAAAEIQKLLKQLEIKNPTATEREKIAYVNVQTNPDIKQRAISALKAGGETAIEEFLANPYVNVGKAIIKGWIQAE
jgi:hypothetical protein